MNQLLAAKAGSAGAHEHTTGAHATGKDAKGNQFDTLLQQAASQQAAPQQAAPQQAASRPEAARHPVPSHRMSEHPQPVTLKARPRSRDVEGDVAAQDPTPHVVRPAKTPTTTPAQDAGHAGHADIASAALADLPLSTTGLRAPPAADVISEADARQAAVSAAVGGGREGGTGRGVRTPVEAVGGRRRLAPPRPSGAAVPTSAAAASGSAGQAGTGRTAAGPIDGVPTRDPAQFEEGVRTPARSAAHPTLAAGPPDMAGPSPTTGPSPTAGPSPQASASLPGVAGQLVRVLAGPQPLADGSTTVTVALDPPSLGVLKATVVAGADHLSVQLVTTTAAGAEALRIALPDLKSVLSSSGHEVQVSVSDSSASTSGGLSAAPQGGGGSRSPFTSRHHPPASPPPSRSSARPASTAPRTTASRTATPATSSHLVDIRI